MRRKELAVVKADENRDDIYISRLPLCTAKVTPLVLTAVCSLIVIHAFYEENKLVFQTNEMIFPDFENIPTVLKSIIL